MKKWQKILILIIVSYICYYLSYGILSLIKVDEKIKTEISLICWILPTIIYFSTIKSIEKKENEEITKASLKIQKLIELNNSYDFKKITKNKHNIREREYSRKSLDRVTGRSIIKYYIENNKDSLRIDIENAIYNMDLLENYLKEVDEIKNLNSENKTKYSLNKYNKVENRVFNSLIHSEEEFMLSLKLEVYYRSDGGGVYDNRQSKATFQELQDIYNEWKNGNKFEETKKVERRIMNDDIRYNVLKRDNYTCQICGATAKDGVKLHVDHIIPVSKGGKTVMSNLQTLCDRCNLGKSNKIDSDFKNMECPLCGGKLIKRKSKYGYFFGCSNYPRCNYTKPTK